MTSSQDLPEARNRSLKKAPFPTQPPQETVSMLKCI